MTTPAATRTIDSRITRRPRAQRHPDADFVRAPRHAIRHHAKQPDGRDQQRETAEHHIGLREEFLLTEAALELGQLSHDVHDRQIRIDLPYGVADRRDRTERISCGPHFERGRALETLRVRRVLRRHRSLADGVVLGVPQNADDFLAAAAVGRWSDAAPDRRLVGEVLARGSLIVSKNVGDTPRPNVVSR